MPYIEKLCSLCEKLGCEYRLNEPLKNHTTFKIGGNAKILVEINSTDTLAELVKFLNKDSVRFFVIGKGSNILAHDDGFDGVILKVSNKFSNVRMTDENEIYCTAGTPLSELCLFALEHSMTGLEFAYGIPGTAGGALFMNAGAYGGEIKDVVVSARCIDKNGNIITINAEDMKLSYRHSIFSENTDYIIADMTFSLEKGEKSEIKSKMDELLQKRKDKQPLEFPSAGSTFKRPEGSYASLLIEQCGLKGMSAGDAQVSEKHSGFVINKGNATFADVLELTGQVKEIVKEKTGYTLELEPIILK
ncbi:MAG: UDP-N-acetylmuramate dehydrogenase [Oscillospiraceae bacterium]|nr:UDP-N-acetylmuramate dehydrogenase [Oscillospiraceae bacterium]